MAHVVFRADAGRSIGSGHIVRSMALAEVFAAGGWRIGFAHSAETIGAVDALSSSKFELLQLPEKEQREPEEIMRRWPEGADILVCDHYSRARGFETSCRPWAKTIVAFDELADREHDADLLIDSSAAAANIYKSLVPVRCRILTGPRYAILRPEFTEARKRGPNAAKFIGNVLISFGQMDEPNATQYAIDALRGENFAGEINVVLGRKAPHRQSLLADKAVHVHTDLSAREMAALMVSSDLAIGAGGGTAWERCFLGLPTILVRIADNQRGVIARITEAGAALDAGGLGMDLSARIAKAYRFFSENNSLLKSAASAASAVMDGRGLNRIFVAAVASAPNFRDKGILLRLAEPCDEVWLLELQRQPQTRRYANNPEIPDSESHRNWFRTTLADSARLLMIIESDGKRAGMLRLDIGPTASRVSIAIDAAHLRKGLGAAGLEFARRLRPTAALEAVVQSENKPSLDLFAKAGYHPVGGMLFRRVPDDARV
jgi:UDP-2,4-diacetamido-2,4,6-trideoxy-beta-L-altropyranose hydrolase